MINRYKKATPPIDYRSADNPSGKPVPEATSPPNKESLQQTVMDSVDVQQLLHICRSTLYSWRKNGLLAFSKVGGKIYFEAADVQQMLKEKKQRKWQKAA